MNYVEFLYRALDSALGIVVKSSDPERLRAKLYAARKEHPDFSNLSIIPSRLQPAEELWIVRKSPNPPKEASNAET